MENGVVEKMSNANTSEKTDAEVKQAASAKLAMDATLPSALSDEELSEVAGGINPQPLPPGMKAHQT
jgi:hypothetical protein